MRKLLLICSALLTLSAAAASAQGLNIGWEGCGLGGAPGWGFSCGTNSGTNTLVGSFVAPAGLLYFTGIEGVLDLETGGPTLSDWWKLKGVGLCRNGSLSLDLDLANSGDPGSCFDYYAPIGGATGGIAAYQVGFGGPNKARIKLVAAVDQTVAGPVPPGLEVFAYNLKISHIKTVGTGACTGCFDGVCIAFNSLRLTQPGIGNNIDLVTPALRNYVTFQNCTFGCPAIVAAHPTSWGAIKALYH